MLSSLKPLARISQSHLWIEALSPLILVRQACFCQVLMGESSWRGTKLGCVCDLGSEDLCFVWVHPPKRWGPLILTFSDQKTWTLEKGLRVLKTVESMNRLDFFPRFLKFRDQSCLSWWDNCSRNSVVGAAKLSSACSSTYSGDFASFSYLPISCCGRKLLKTHLS